MRKRDQELVEAIGVRVRGDLAGERAALVAELREAVRVAEHPQDWSLYSLEAAQESGPPVHSSGYPSLVVTCVLTVAAMLENKADTMRIVTGEDAARERGLRARIEDLRANCPAQRRLPLGEEARYRRRGQHLRR